VIALAGDESIQFRAVNPEVARRGDEAPVLPGHAEHRAVPFDDQA